ncbi:hypothetical protein EVAR_11662_1 [Eumeta japonica]|uniref:Uncharacterized protein n=1 Tax=Eumeta variegata TaxID=151549 RepID=A0A4C1U574_EUMVA|nr:hypothetical protein EVAR_11662_1 [Eumeta japonica]
MENEAGPSRPKRPHQLVLGTEIEDLLLEEDDTDDDFIYNDEEESSSDDDDDDDITVNRRLFSYQHIVVFHLYVKSSRLRIKILKKLVHHLRLQTNSFPFTHVSEKLFDGI